jgi:hypothetical protein
MNLSPLPIQKFFDNNGEPLVGGLLYTYVAGTTTKIATYTDSTGGSVNTNPIVLDYRGEARVWLDVTKTYKFVLSPRGDTDPPTKAILTVDNIASPVTLVDLTQQVIGSILFPQTAEEAAAGVVPVNYWYPDGWVDRYATNTTPGTTSMATALSKAIASRPASGGTVYFLSTPYNITGLYKSTSADGVWATNTKANVTLRGMAMPHVNSTGTALEGGTILQGSVINTADGFKVFDLGVDVGQNVVTNLYGGNYHEGFVPGVNINYPTPTTTIKGVVVDRVSSLAHKPTGVAATWMHSMLFENLEDCIIGSVDACGGFHCFVSKIKGLQAASITARGGEMQNALLFKSDPANKCEQNEIANVRIVGWTLNGVAQAAGPLRFEQLASGGGANTTDSIKIANCIIRDTVSDSVVMQNPGIAQNISFGHLDVNTTAVACAVRIGVNTTFMQRFTIGTFNIVTGARAFDLGTGATDVHIGSGIITVTGDGNVPILTFNNPSQTHGKISIQILVAQTNTYQIWRQGNSVVDMSLIEFGGVTIAASRFITSFPGTFTFNATNFADSGNAAFGVFGAVYQPYKVTFKGGAKCILSGATINIGTVAPPPLKVRRFPVAVETAGVMGAGYIQIDTLGVITFLGTPALNAIVFLDVVEYDALVQ